MFFTTMDVLLNVVLPSTATNVSQVEIREGATLVSVTTNVPHIGALAPYLGTWHHPSAGTHTLIARANFSSGTVTTSETVNVSVSVPPTLGFACTTNQVKLSWPIAPAGFMIESATNLSPPILWSPLTNPVQIIRGHNNVTVIVTNNNRFFRLRLP
jgi:hypothetical protein